MASITVRKRDGSEMVPGREWEPTRWMRDFIRWDPFRELAPFRGVDVERMAFEPTFEVKETKDGFLFKADVPGVKEEDLEVTLTGNRLMINGKREAEMEERTDTYYTCERSYGSFTRTFTLPEGIDTEHLRAELKDGVLTVALPKKPEMQPKKIPLQGATKKA